MATKRAKQKPKPPRNAAAGARIVVDEQIDRHGSRLKAATDRFYAKNPSATVDNAIAAIQVEATKAAIDEAIERYEKTGNGAHIWEAYALARWRELPLHAAVLKYFDNCAQSVLAGGSPKGIAIGMQLGQDVGGKGGGVLRSAESRRFDAIRDYEFERTMIDRKVKGAAINYRDARRRVASMYGISEGTLDQWFKGRKR